MGREEQYAKLMMSDCAGWLGAVADHARRCYRCTCKPFTNTLLHRERDHTIFRYQQLPWANLACVLTDDVYRWSLINKAMQMIILIRHAQSEGNKNREIHQLIPDHRVKLTEDGWVQVDAFLHMSSRPTNEAVIN